MENIEYVYVNEDKINHLLICEVCNKPYIDPIVTKTGQRCCRLCLPKLVNIDTFPSLSQFVVQLDETILRTMLDDLQVKCINCNEINIQRKHFREHLLTQCPKRYVQCKAYDLNCPWRGLYDQLNNHIQQCLFEHLRPALSIRSSHEYNFDEYHKIINEQRDEIEQIKKQIEIYKDRTEIFQENLQKSIEINNEQNKNLEDIRKDVDIIRKYLNKYDFQHNEIEQLKTTVVNQNNQVNDLENIRRNIEEHFQQTEILMKKYQDQYSKQIQYIQKEESLRRNELVRLRQISDQHEIQIRLLARKKCTISSRSNMIINDRLRDLLAKYPPNTDINLDGKDCDNDDLEYIAKVAIREKQCRKLRLENNKITSKGVSILVDALYGNSTLTELHLSNNFISDIGVHLLAQVLSIQNSSLTWLEINATGITDDGTDYLADMLRVNKSLILLGLSFNQISDRGVLNLTAAIGYNQTLQWLHLGSNRLITDGSVESLMDMFVRNKSLQAVYINNCNFSNNAIKELKKEVQKKSNFFLEI